AGASQALAGTGAAGAAGSGTLAGAAQSLAGSGTVTPPPVTGSGGLAGAAQSLAGSGAVTPRTLILSLAPAAGTDPYGNDYPAGLNATTGQISGAAITGGTVDGTVITGSVLENSAGNPKTSIGADGSIKITNSAGDLIFEIGPDGTVTWYSAAGAVLMQQSPAGVLSIQDPALIEFPSGQSWEEPGPANILAQVGGTSPAQYIQMALEGPAITTTGAHDRVWIVFNSAAEDDSSSANLGIQYQGSNGVFHQQAVLDETGFNILAGSITAADPGSSPAVPASWHTIALQNGYTAGTNNGYTDVPQLRMMADNKTLAFKGSLTVPSSPSSAVWGLLPAGFPNANFGGPYGLGAVSNYSGGTGDHVQVQNNDNLSLANYSAHGGDTFNITCMVPTQ
ncbi:MAG: hypothetical protein ACRDNZ_16395, partial [Streptosporangiaceae bacterium]